MGYRGGSLPGQTSCGCIKIKIPVLANIVPNDSHISHESGKCTRKEKTGNSLVVQWLGRCSFTAEGAGSIPGWGTKIPQAMGCGQKKGGGTHSLLSTPRNSQGYALNPVCSGPLPHMAASGFCLGDVPSLSHPAVVVSPVPSLSTLG